MQCILAAVGEALATVRGVGTGDVTNAAERAAVVARSEAPSNEFVLNIVGARSSPFDHRARAVVQMACSLRRWLAEVSMELADYAPLFARVDASVFLELFEAGLLLAAAACVGVAASRRSVAGARRHNFERVAADFVRTAEVALNRRILRPPRFGPTIATMCVLGDDAMSVEAMRELCGASAERESKCCDLAIALRDVVAADVPYSSLLLACDHLPIPTQQSREYLRCLRRCLAVLGPENDAFATLAAIATACPAQGAIEVFHGCRRSRALDAPLDCDWSFLLLATFAVFDDAFSHVDSHLSNDVVARASELLLCLCCVSRCKLGAVAIARALRPPSAPIDAMLRADALACVARSPSGLLSPGFSSPEAAEALCEWASCLLDPSAAAAGVDNDFALNCVREFANVPSSKRARAWHEPLARLRERVDALLDERRGPLPPFLARANARFRAFARAAVDEAARSRAPRDPCAAVGLCLWVPVDASSKKRDVRTFARRFANPLAVDPNDALYEFEDALRSAWAKFQREGGPPPPATTRGAGRYDLARLDETTDAILATSSGDGSIAAFATSDVDRFNAMGRPAITVVRWSNAASTPSIAPPAHLARVAL